MSDMREWLESIGCGRYADAFEANALEWDLLPELNDEDLEKIGVAALGHRKRILKAISSLDAPVELPPPALTTPPGTPGQSEPERRQLTVMFADLAGSTELSQALDPEDLRHINRLYQDAPKAAIESYGGYVARYMGDGVLAYFGYPQAHEDDAERAVRGGLRLVEAVSKLEVGPALAVRVGIATGPVVVGDLIGEGASQESAVVGETPNLAARIQDAAQPNTVVLADSTRLLVEGLFDCTDLGVRVLKGFREAQPLWHVTKEIQSVSRFEAMRSRRAPGFIGRKSELALLLERWETCKAGEGQVILIEGEPGIGKSRLTDEFRRAIASTPHTAIRYQCSPHHTNTAYSPFVSQLHRACQFVPSDGVEERLDKLEATLSGKTAQSSHALWLFARLLSLPTNRYPSLELEPRALKSATMDALCAQLVALCDYRPVVVAFEDVHWIDPTSLEALDQLVGLAHGLRVLFVITHRPEFDSPWDAHGFVTELRLNRLARRDGAALIRELSGGKELPVEISQQILRKTDGVALFVEELTKTVLESGLLLEGEDRFVLDGSVPELAIPSTLRDSLMARLDRSLPAKKVAQVGACIGREFSYHILRSVADLDEGELQSALGRLLDDQLIFRRGNPPDSSYRFKHALVQDAAYDSLLLTRRRALHASIVSVLEETHRNNLTEFCELLAHHSVRAEMWESALKYLNEAGMRAYARSANHESIAHFEGALAALERLPPSSEIDAQAIGLRIQLRNPVFMLGDMERCLRLLRETERLAASLGEDQLRGQALVHISSQLWMAGDSLASRDLARDALAIAHSVPDPALTAQANCRVGAASFTLGDYLETESAYGRALVIVREHPVVAQGFDMPGGAEVISHSYLTWASGDLGRFDEGIEHGREAISLSDAAGQAFGRTWARWALAHLYQVRGEHGESLRLVDDATEIATRASLGVWPTFLDWIRGHVYARLGRIEEGISLMRGALDTRVAQGLGTWNALIATHLGEALVRANRLDEARGTVDKALALARDGSERGHEAWALRLLAEVTARSDFAYAKACYEDAKDLAEALGMYPLMAHCYLGMGAMYQRAGQHGKAEEHVEEATGLYRKMAMHYFSAAAKEVLDSRS